MSLGSLVFTTIKGLLQYDPCIDVFSKVSHQIEIPKETVKFQRTLLERVL